MSYSRWLAERSMVDHQPSDRRLAAPLPHLYRTSTTLYPCWEMIVNRRHASRPWTVNTDDQRSR
jgi:hypothetical protein